MNAEHVVHTKVDGGSVIMHLYGGSGIQEVWKLTHVNAATTASYVMGVIKLWEGTVGEEITDWKFHNNPKTNAVSEVVRKSLREGEDD